MDWTSFGRVRTAMTVRDYDIVMLALGSTRASRSRPPTASTGSASCAASRLPGDDHPRRGGSELAAIRTLRLGAADYLPKRLLTPPRLQRSIKLTLRAIEKEAQRRAERLALAAQADRQKAQSRTEQTRRHERTAARAPPAPLRRFHAHRRHPGRCRADRERPEPRRARAQFDAHGRNLARAARAALTPVQRAAPASSRQSPVRDAAAVSLPAQRGSSRRDQGTEAGGADESPDSGLHHPAEDRRVRSRGGVPRDRRGPRPQRGAEDRKRKHRATPNDTGQRSIMFQREFEAIAALDHPSIIDLFDYGIHEGVEFLAMEYFPCGDLKARLQNRSRRRSHRVPQGNRALPQGVHEAGIIHRDLKPPNVMLRDDGSVVLIDFGLARSLLSG
jgi:hypothetical protein